MYLFDIVTESIEILKNADVENYLLGAETIIAAVLEIDRFKIITENKRELLPAEIKKIRKAVAKRKNSEPLAYIIGEKEFYSLPFVVNKDVLIPRPETELLVDLGIYYGKMDGAVLDLCTGSGAIAVALKYNRKDLNISASDISEKSIKIAKKNALNITGKGSIKFKIGDLFAPFPDEKFNLIISNPPYVNRELIPTLEKELFHEPESALFAEDKGRAIIVKIVKEAARHLYENGILLLEIGSEMKEFIEKIGGKHKFDVSLLNDYSGLTRVAVLKMV